jgi:hypothetical protein
VVTLILALAAGGCLAVGWLTGQIVLVYVALGVSGAGLVLMAVQVWRRRRAAREEPPPAADGDDASEPADTVAGNDEPREAEGERPENESEAPEPVTALVAGVEDTEEPGASRERLAEDSTVYVLSGRRRFHLVDCRLLEGRDTEELTLIDAEEEAFTPCTICMESANRELLAEQY